METTTFTRIARDAPFCDEGYGYDVFGLQPAYLARAVAAARPIYEHYFRVDSRGAEHVPPDGPTIIVANHAGVLPVDAAMLCLDLLQHLSPPRIPRAIADTFVPRLPLVGTLFARLGVVSGTRANVRRLLERGELLALWPEGITGPAKSFADRYQIQEWRVGFAELAIRHSATVVPAAIVGAEESWPLLGKLRGVHAFGAPYVPIPATPVPLPVRYHVRYGAPMQLALDARDADDPGRVAAAAAEVRVAIEQLLDDLIEERPGVFR
jgi:1-acyl-sn-glycerol-3-phosphate acyltransferase